MLKLIGTLATLALIPKACRWIFYWYCAHKTRTTVITLSRRVGYVLYYVNGTEYRTLVSTVRRPTKIACITSNDIDISDDVFPYLGASETYDHRLTPGLLGYDNITFTMLNGKSYTFTKNESIDLDMRSIPPTIRK